jgi:hypothetical protein
VIDQATADKWLEIEVNEKAAGVLSALGNVKANQNQFDALVSFAYNVGIGALSSSTMLKKIKSGNMVGAADEFLRWVNAGGEVLEGLVNRRKDERALFLKAGPAATPQPKPVAPVPPSPAPIPPPPDIEPPEASHGPPDAGTSIAAILLGAVGALVAALAAWIIGGR